MASPSQGKPDIVRRRHRSAQGMLVHILDLEILEEAALPALFRCHERVPLPYVLSMCSR